MRAAVRAEVAKAVIGQDAAVTGVLIGLLCRGHVLIEGVPGVAKTLLVRTLAAALDLQTTMRASKNSPAIRQFSIHTWDHLVEERRAGMRALIDMLAAGKLKPRIHAKLPLTEAARAHEMLEGGEVLGKLLLVP